MAKYIFSNIIGSFVFNQDFKIVDKALYNSVKDFKNKQAYETKLADKHGKLLEPTEKDIEKILISFKDNKYYNVFYRRNLKLTKEGIKEAVQEDTLIIQAVSNVQDIEKVINVLVKRLRDWYSFYNPEFEESIESNEKFIELVITKKKDELLAHINIKKDLSMGADFSEKDLEPLINLAKEIKNLYDLKKKQEEYIGSILMRICPNLKKVAGAVIGAKLIEEAGSLKHLALLPATTIQLLGAEKALFRHIRNKKNLPPKFGIIFNHPFIQKNMKNSGKAARALADKISMAVKVDFFKGEPIADKLVKELEEKFK